MQLASFINPDLILCHLSASSKKRLFESVAHKISEQCPEVSETTIFDGLFARERLGSTGLGDGVAVPHCRITETESNCCAVVSIETPISFDAPDNKPVDLLVFLVVSGEACQDHLDRLAIVAKSFSDPDFRQSVRDSKSNEELKNLIFAET
jgi:PTS system nitrogen regulatory IIA component